MNRLDALGDTLLEPLRRRKIFVTCFGIASTVGDFSIAWHIIGFTRAIGSAERLWQAVALSVALGIESLIVNQGIKRLFRRERPTTAGDHRFDIRTPSTSSFPSGHASSATFAVFILISYTGFPLGVLWIGLALVIALSRVVVRIHHATDILGGIITGAILGSIAIPVISVVIGSR
jgi:membrane-associated phospholipid phosphatase